MSIKEQVLISSGKRYVTTFLLLFILGLTVFCNSFSNKFIIDDYGFLNDPLMTNPHLLWHQWELKKKGSFEVLGPESKMFYYRPLDHILVGLCYISFKNDFWKYHLFNLFFFVLAAFVFYLCIERISKNYLLAFLASVFYLIHPINGIVVNYISASIFAVQIILMSGSILFLWESVQNKNKKILYFLSLVFFILALLCHETSILTPFYSAAVIFLAMKLNLRKKIRILVPYFLILGLYFLFRMEFFGAHGSILQKLQYFHLSFIEYIATAYKFLIWYMSRLFYPKGIVFVWTTPIVREYLWWVCLQLLALIVLFLSCFLIFRRNSIVRIALVWIVIGFLPFGVMMFCHGTEGIILEPHWFIFSVIGFFILLAQGLIYLKDRISIWIWSVIVFLLVFSYGVVSFSYNKLWGDEKTYTTYWLGEIPQFHSIDFHLAHANLRENNFSEAKKHYLIAASNVPNLKESGLLNVAYIEMNQGHLKEAEGFYKLALSLNKNGAIAYYLLGQFYLKSNQLVLAQESFIKSVEINPYRLETYYLLIDVLWRRKDSNNLDKYGHMYINVENDPQALTQFGSVMAQEKYFGIALDSFNRALQIDSDCKEAYLEAGKLLGNLNRFDEAIHMWKLGLEKSPQEKNFIENIVKARKMKLLFAGSVS